MKLVGDWSPRRREIDLGRTEYEIAEGREDEKKKTRW